MSLYHPLDISTLRLEGNLFLAPVADWTDKVFRSLCIEEGADFTFTELVSSEALVRNLEHTKPYLERLENEARYAIQIFGAKDVVMGEAAKILLRFSPSLIDINAGCPVPKVVKTGAGAALMKDPHNLEKITRAVVLAANGIPVSVKMRSGWDASSINYLECAARCVDAGAAMITLHPRTRAQSYGGRSEWRHIGELAAKLNVPVTGSGDLWAAGDAKRMLLETNCAAVMFARGAMGNPFIFDEARKLLRGESADFETAEHSFDKKLKIAFKHLELLSRSIGEERAARKMRKMFCAYIKDVPNAAAFRAGIVKASSIEDYKLALAGPLPAQRTA